MVIKDRAIIFKSRNPQASVTRAIEGRVDQFFADRSVAAALDEGIVQMYLPPSFRGDWEHFVGVTTHLYSNSSAEFAAAKAKELAAEAVDPAWITLSPDNKFLYAVDGSASQARGFKVEAGQSHLIPLARNDALSAGTPPFGPPSHLAVDATGRALLAANYHNGFVASVPVRADGTLGLANVIRHEGKGPQPTRQDKPHIHSVTLSPDNRFVIVADLGLDRVYSYALEAGSAELAPASPPFVQTAPQS